MVILKTSAGTNAGQSRSLTHCIKNLHRLYPDVTNRTKSNVRLIELNRTQSNPITRLGSIESDDRTQSNPHKKIGLIEPDRTFECAEIAEFFLEIVTRLTTLLLLIALLANMAVSFISRYLVDVVLKTAFFVTNLHYLIVR